MTPADFLNMPCAIIVSYNPDLGVLRDSLDILQHQTSHVVVVDNASQPSVIASLRGLVGSMRDTTLLENSENLGVAAALNQAVDFARDRGFEFVLMMDQDSIAAPDMVEQLSAAYSGLVSVGNRVAVVGPNYRDVKNLEQSPFVRLDGLRLIRVPCVDDEVVEVDHLITSGSLVPLSVLGEVGGMIDELFIDYVDTEWCLRAQSKGYRLYGVGSAHMIHDLGDSLATFRGREITVHSPLRYYYILRNGVWLLRQPWITWKWRVSDVRRLSILYVVCSLFIGDRYRNWKMMSLGLRHGLIGKMGKLEEK